MFAEEFVKYVIIVLKTTESLKLSIISALYARKEYCVSIQILIRLLWRLFEIWHVGILESRLRLRHNINFQDKLSANFCIIPWVCSDKMRHT